MADFNVLMSFKVVPNLPRREVAKIEVYCFGNLGFVVSNSPKAFVWCKALVTRSAEVALYLASVLGLAIAFVNAAAHHR